MEGLSRVISGDHGTGAVGYICWSRRPARCGFNRGHLPITPHPQVSGTAVKAASPCELLFADQAPGHTRCIMHRADARGEPSSLPSLRTTRNAGIQELWLRSGSGPHLKAMRKCSLLKAAKLTGWSYHQRTCRFLRSIINDGFFRLVGLCERDTRQILMRCGAEIKTQTEELTGGRRSSAWSQNYTDKSPEQEER